MILGDDKHSGLIRKKEVTAQDFRGKCTREGCQTQVLYIPFQGEKSWSDPLCLKLSLAKSQGLDSPQGFGQPAEAHKLVAGLTETPAVVKGQKSAPSGPRTPLQHLLEAFVLLCCLSILRGSGWVFASPAACPLLHQALLQGRASGSEWDEPRFIYHSQRQSSGKGIPGAGTVAPRTDVGADNDICV